MKNKKYLLVLIFILISLLLLSGFNNMEIFKRDNNVDNDYILTLSEIKHDDDSVKPRDALIRLVSDTIYYRVIYNTPILDKPMGNDLRRLKEGELLVQVGIDGEHGIFTTLKDSIEGYVDLGDLKAEPEDSIFYGISTVDKVVKNEDSIYVLAKGEPVIIKESKDSNIVIINEEEAEFIVNNSDIEIARGNESVSRTLVSRKNKNLSKIINAAYELLGKPYVYGDIGRRGYDCSGLVYSIYLNQLGIELPRSSSAQAKVGKKINRSELAPGDLLFFGSARNISHVGLYIGEGKMIHASTGKMQVKIDSIDNGYYKNRVITAKRIIE